MARNEQPDFSFDYPRDWEDRSVVAYAAPQQPGRPATNVVFTRDKVDASEALGSYAARQLVDIAKRFQGFEFVERNEIVIDGEPAVDIHFRWRGSSGKLAQRMTMLRVTQTSILNITCTAIATDATRYRPLFDRIIASVRLRKAGTVDA